MPDPKRRGFLPGDQTGRPKAGPRGQRPPTVQPPFERTAQPKAVRRTVTDRLPPGLAKRVALPRGLAKKPALPGQRNGWSGTKRTGTGRWPGGKPTGRVPSGRTPR